MNILNQRNDTALKVSFIRRYHIVGGHDIADGCKHALIPVLLEFFADDSVQESSGDGLDPGFDR